MNEQIALSIIVPVYNLEAFLPETLESLLKIDFEAPYEIIAVDDGSSDGSLAVLRAYEEKSGAVHVITGANGGVSRARNAGIEAARGEYLAFADGDDTVEPGFFAAAVREMEEGGYGLVQGNARYLENGQVRMTLPGCGRRASAGDPEELAEWFFGQEQALLFSVWAKVFRRDLVGETRFEPGVRVGEDLQFLSRLLRKGPKTLVLDMDAYNYYVRESSVANTGYAEKGWDAVRVLEECGKEADSPRIRQHTEKRKTDVLVRIYNTALLNGGDPGKALRAIRETDLRAIREDLTGKERMKLWLLQRCRGLYDVLLRVVKF